MKAIDITYNLLFSKKENGEYNYIVGVSLSANNNVLYGKEIFIPNNIDKGRDNLFQALGYIGTYGNNEYDESIHYILLPDKTADALMLGVKDDCVQQLEKICTQQKESYKDPKRWRFNLKFIQEKDVLDFIKSRPEKLAIKQIQEYERSH